MQDIQNIPNPNANSTEREDEFGNHSDIERENESNRDIENKQLPPDEPNVPQIEEPPAETERKIIGGKKRKATLIV